MSDFEGLKLDILPRNHALNMQRERAYAWGLMMVLQGYLPYAYVSWWSYRGTSLIRNNPPFRMTIGP